LKGKEDERVVVRSPQDVRKYLLIHIDIIAKSLKQLFCEYCNAMEGIY